MNRTGPTKEFAEEQGISRRHARARKAEGSATPDAKSNRERYEKARAERTEAQAALGKIELETLRGNLVSKKENAEALREIVEQVKAAMFFECGSQLAVENAGLDAAAQARNNHAAVSRALRSLDEWAAKKLAP